MSAFPVAYLARHGATAWTVSRRHTGWTDLPLSAEGELEAVKLGERLKGMAFTSVLTSPLQRAVRTCELAGFGAAAEVEPDLLEWNYGNYAGQTTPEVRTQSRKPLGFRDLRCSIDDPAVGFAHQVAPGRQRMWPREPGIQFYRLIKKLQCVVVT